MRHGTCLVLLLLTSLINCPGADTAAPFIDSKAVKERFAEITAKDMELLRSKRILFASRSFGLNLRNGLEALAKQDAKYQLLGAYQRYDVAKAGGDLSIIPADAFSKNTFVHFLATYWPHTKRVEEMDTLLRGETHHFADSVDAVIIFYHTATPAAFDTYATKMDALRADFPRIRFIYVTAGFMGPSKAKDNEAAHAFSEQVRQRYKGSVPIYDLGALLSDDFRVGHVYCPEYSKDPADVHPNLPAGESVMAKGFLLVLRDALRMREAAASTSTPRTSAPAATTTETLPATHPEAKAVRAILDANGLTAKTVDGVSVVRKGHIVELFLQEAGITTLPDDIGILTSLERLHVYGDRALGLPLLTTISPALGKCVKIEDLLLNNNDLATLPLEITRLTRLKTLSIADNRLGTLPPAITTWAKRFDAPGLAQQHAP